MQEPFKEFPLWASELLGFFEVLPFGPQENLSREVRMGDLQRSWMILSVTVAAQEGLLALEICCRWGISAPCRAALLRLQAACGVVLPALR